MQVKFSQIAEKPNNECEVRLSQFELFGARIDNVTMHNAVSSLSSSAMNGRTQTACFVNVNSFNLAHSNKSLLNAINDADFVFADVKVHHPGVMLTVKGGQVAGLGARDNKLGFIRGTKTLEVLPLGNIAITHIEFQVLTNEL